MKTENIAFKSPVDGLLIDAILAVPEGEAKGVIVMAHGIAEYKERYLKMMEIFTGAGFACAINDHRGYGKSVKDASDYGYTYSAGAEGTVTLKVKVKDSAKAAAPTVSAPNSA